MTNRSVCCHGERANRRYFLCVVLVCYATSRSLFPLPCPLPSPPFSTPLFFSTTPSPPPLSLIIQVGKTFMVEETANKFVVVGADFMPLLREQGVVYSDIPAWVVELAARHTPW